MRIERRATALSWIPSEALRGLGRLGEVTGLAHHDPPPPHDLGPDPTAALAELRCADRFRFANLLRAWVDVRDGHIAGYGYDSASGGTIGSTTLNVGVGNLSIPAFKLDDLQLAPDVGPRSVRFVQTIGGRTGVPLPRPLRRPPFVQFHAPIVWTTLALTIDVDGGCRVELIGASAFPRHWVYGDDGRLRARSAVADWHEIAAKSFGANTPWGGHDSPALVAAVETALERELSTYIMQGGPARPEIRRVRRGQTITSEGEPGDEVFLQLDGIVSVARKGAELAEIGPGAVFGERALIEGGRRTSTIVARTDCRLAVAPRDALDVAQLTALAANHRREERPCE